jgi:hypothetical protein
VVADILTGRFKASTIFAIDLTDLLAPKVEDQRALQESRASETLWPALSACLQENEPLFGQWVDENDRIRRRMDQASQTGGKAIWQRRYLNQHSPLIMVNHNHGLSISGHSKRDGVNLDPSGARYRQAFVESVDYRLTREGVLVSTYDVDFRAATYTIPAVIEALTKLREDSFATLHQFVKDYFGEPRRLARICKATGLQLDRAQVEDAESVAEAAYYHSLVAIERFVYETDAGVLTPVTLDNVVQSRELAGVLNEAWWYAHYGDPYCSHLAAKEFGYREDEIYVIERRTSVIVADRCWKDDPMIHYRHDIQLIIQHHVAAIALLMQQIAFFREYDEVRPIETHDPVRVLPLVLAARSNLTLLNESLDFSALVRHGFSRLFAQQLRHEMDFDQALEALSQRVADMGEAVALKSSVQSADASLQRASRNNFLQALAVVLAVAAVIVTLVLR